MMAYHVYDIQIWAPLLEQLVSELLKNLYTSRKRSHHANAILEAQKLTIFG